MAVYFLITLFVAYTASGLQSSVLGAAWPVAYQDLGVGLSMLSYVNMIVAGGRIVAGLSTDRIVRRIGTQNAAILGFSLNCICIFGCANSHSYLMLCISCILLGFGDTLLVCSLNSTVISGIFCAGGDTRFGLICDMLTMWAVVVPAGLLAAFVLELPVIWVYVVLNIDEIIKLSAVYRHYKKYQWVKNITKE